MLAQLMAGQQLPELGADSEDAYRTSFLLALQSFRDQRYDEARTRIAALRASHSDQLGPLGLSAAIDLATGQWESARGILEQVLQRDPANASARINLARLALNDRDFARIDTLIRPLADQRPNDENAGTPDKALAVLGELSPKQIETTPIFLELQGTAYLAKGDAEAARTAFMHLSRIAPDAAYARVLLAQATLARRSTPAAAGFPWRPTRAGRGTPPQSAPPSGAHRRVALPDPVHPTRESGRRRLETCGGFR